LNETIDHPQPDADQDQHKNKMQDGHIFSSFDQRRTQSVSQLAGSLENSRTNPGAAAASASLAWS
jgi:hypothetical protein